MLAPQMLDNHMPTRLPRGTTVGTSNENQMQVKPNKVPEKKGVYTYTETKRNRKLHMIKVYIQWEMNKLRRN